jgi:tetratricopeptide (TPR) repeat protein
MNSMAPDAAIDSIRSLITAEQYTSALTSVEAALVGDPQDDGLLYLKLVTLLRLKRYAEALPLSIQLLAPAPADAGRWLALCSALRALGFVELALQANAHALNQVTSPDYELTSFRGETLFRDYRYDEALDAYQPALTQFGQQAQSWPIWYNYATCLSEEGNVADSQEANRRALRLLQQLLARGSVTEERELATLWYYQGVLFARLGRLALAKQLLFRSLSVDASNYETAHWLYDVIKAQHNPIGAALGLPFLFWNGLAKKRREDKEQQDILDQRASVSQVTLQHVRTLIGQ